MFKRFLICAVSVLSLIALSACGDNDEDEEFDNDGFPSVVRMSKGVDNLTVSGGSSYDYVELSDFNGDGVAMYDGRDNGSTSPQWYAVDINGIITPNSSISYKWLTIKADDKSEKLTLVSQPNNTGKKRAIYIYVRSKNSGSIEIDVLQNK
jgi:hypothetical protein